MSILLTKGNVEDVFKVLDNHNINSALMLDIKLKVLEIIIEKNVDISLIKKYDFVEDYNSTVWIAGRHKLVKEEFNLLKEVLGE